MDCAGTNEADNHFPMTMSNDSRGGAPAETGTLRSVSVAAARVPLGMAALRLALVSFLPLAGIVAAPVLAASKSTVAPARPAKQRFSFDTALTPFQPTLTDPAKFSFTASGNAAAARLQTVERAFRFTPSGQGDNRKALALGVTSRITAPAPDRSRAAAPQEQLAQLPTSYNVDLSVGWKGFAVNTGFSRVDPGPLALLPGGRREAIDVGLSYRGPSWKTNLQATAEQSSELLFSPLERRYSVELGGAYLVSPRLSVSGGLRYKLAPDAPSIMDPNRPDQTVYLGTNFAF